MPEALQKTPFYPRHIALGAKMVPFAGYEMPVYYQSIRQEHLHVRRQVGLFDVSHMGEFIVTGVDAAAFVDRMTINNVSRLAVNQVQYSAMCYEDGGIVDDLLVYRFADHFLLVVNASNIEKDFNWLQQNLAGDVILSDRSADYALLALQGPRALELLNPLTDLDLAELPYYSFREGELDGQELIFSRTGYTGEIGFELYIPTADSLPVWDRLMEAGSCCDLQPVGLGARDSLRLEMKFCLYGNDIDRSTTPLEAGLGWITKTGKKGDFIGKSVLSRQREEGVSRRLVGFELLEKGIPRPGYPVLIDQREVGTVTSGMMSPMLNRGIGLVYLPVDRTAVGQELQVAIRDRHLPGRVVETPFYKPGE
ncbi:MAG: glycine cleavage system aminomethyltransferase GcvT [Candidatus Delongbacteria bacterium]|nr:glycine cleavage system aminomethyltransferase GcvT [Candidatus Delongbacteria bacterium]